MVQRQNSAMFVLSKMRAHRLRPLASPQTRLGILVAPVRSSAVLTSQLAKARFWKQPCLGSWLCLQTPRGLGAAHTQAGQLGKSLAAAAVHASVAGRLNSLADSKSVRPLPKGQHLLSCIIMPKLAQQ